MLSAYLQLLGGRSMAFEIVWNDIVKMKADAVVNTTNSEPFYAEGVDYAIYAAAGAEELLEKRKTIGKIEEGTAAITPALALDAKYIIHTVGPRYIDGNSGEKEILDNCYKAVLSLAREYKCESIALPLISTGANKFPKWEGMQVALSAIGEFLQKESMKIYLVVYDQESQEVALKLFLDVSKYIERRYIDLVSGSDLARTFKTRILKNFYDFSEEDTYQEETYYEGCGIFDEHYDEENIQSDIHCHTCYCRDIGTWRDSDELEHIVAMHDDTFSEKLLQLIDQKGKNDIDVYKNANISKQLFSKIRSNRDYRPTKTTVIVLALALELNIDETKDLLLRAGYALSPASKFDLIVQYYITHKIYNVCIIDLKLDEYEQPLLGKGVP